MAVAALLFAFLDTSSAPLQVTGTASPEIVVIMQATILLAAVIAYEVVNRVKQADEVRRAALATEAVSPSELEEVSGPDAMSGEVTP